jgi:hypothetical protein
LIFEQKIDERTLPRGQKASQRLRGALYAPAYGLLGEHLAVDEFIE